MLFNNKALTKTWTIIAIAMIALIFFSIGYMIANLYSTPINQSIQTSNMTIIDSSGKYITLNVPVKRIVVLTSDAAIAIKLLNASNAIVGVSDVVAKYPTLFKELSNLTNVGKWQSPDYETIVKLKPEVVISYTRWPGSELEEKLEPMGIKVVRLDLYIPSTMTQELKILGILLGKEKEAEKICKWINDLEKLISDRLSKIKEEDKIRSYLETYTSWSVAGPGSGLYDLAIKAGLKPIGEFTIPYPKVSAEWVIKQNPDFIVKPVIVNPIDATIEDYEIVKSDVINRLNITNAVKNNRIIILPGRLAYNPSYPIAVLCIAKSAYPSLFNDLDPKVLLQQYLSFLGLELKGIWWYPW
ncbi:MAG: ABC transporter substrate-binding protein [Candidatus Methanomethylicaceae archaeon]|nr:ABC transporter substrate-binding protein [Candidatus Verstraetearchaeota archaeon]